MKIIYNIPNIIRMAGMERILAIKANYLAGLTGLEVVIITYEQKKSTLGFLIFRIKSGFMIWISIMQHVGEKNIFWNKIRRIIYTKRHQRRLEEILLKEKPDITISMMTGREREWLYRLKDGSKKILECHFSYFSYQNVKGIINRYKIKRFLNKIKYYDRLVVLTEEDRKDWGRKDNIVVIPNALTFLS